MNDRKGMSSIIHREFTGISLALAHICPPLSPSYTSQQVTGFRPKSQSLQTDRWISARVLRLFSLLDSSMVLQSRQEAWSRRSDFMAASVGLDRKLERVPREVCTPFTFSSYHPLCLLDVHRLVCLWVYGFFWQLMVFIGFFFWFCFVFLPVRFICLTFFILLVILLFCSLIFAGFSGNPI